MEQKKKVLIIGKNSYIAKHLKRYIEQKEQNWEVDAVGASNDEWRTTDFAGFDSVVMCAGMVHKKETSKNKALYYKVNVELALEAAKKAKESQVTQYVFLSTIAVYGKVEGCLTSQTKEEPTTEYGRTKLLAEQKLKELSSENFTVSIVRPPMVYGPDCPGNFSRLVRLISKVHFFPELKNQRSVIYIDNLSSFLMSLIRKREDGVFHPQDDAYLCTSDIAKAMKNSGSAAKIFLVPHLGVLVRIAGIFLPPIRKMFGSLICDRDSLKTEEKDYIVLTQKEAVQKSTESCTM